MKMKTDKVEPVVEGSSVTVRADLYLGNNGDRGTAIWSTHKSEGFIFAAKPGEPQPFTYKALTGGVIRGWDDGVATSKSNSKTKL